MNLKNIIPERYHDPKALNALSKARRIVVQDGNFTSVVFVNKNLKAVAGVAKRNPGDDEPNHETGVRIATVRAYRAYQREGWR